MSKFDDISLGDKASINHLVTQDDIEKFVQLTGDDNKLHINEEYAATTSFKKPVVHGMLGASFISTIIGTKLPGDGALWFSQNLEFLLPVRIGDKLQITAEVIKKTEKLQIIELKTDIFNQHKQKVTTGIAKVKIVEPITEADELISEKALQKVALIVGATGGIGTTTSLKLAESGFDVILHFHGNKTHAFQLKDKIEKLGRKAEVIQADITSESDVEEMEVQIKNKFGYLSAIINCSTLKTPAVKFELLDWEDMQSHLDVNIKGNFLLLKHLLPLMLVNSYGKIVLMTTQAIENPNADWLPYITAKSALHGFAKALAVEYAMKGIRVNLVSPGMTETDLIADIPEKIKLLTAAKTPLRRIATPEDVANAISFLASEDSDFITGETIRINGGQVMI